MATTPCEGRVSLHLQVWSDEPDEDQTGDGNHTGDARLEVPELYLRAERKGDADGRVYLVIGRATSGSGTIGTVCRTVTVARSNSRADQAAVRTQASAAEGYCAEEQGPPPGFVLLAEGTFSSGNRAPRVNAGPDQAIEYGLPAELVGEVTDDGQPGGTLSVLWSQVSGPGTATFDSAAAARTLVSFSEPGVYVLRLTASDSALEASDDVAVTVEAGNHAPVVDAGPDATLVAPTLSLSLAGSATDDGRPSGSLAIRWTQVIGPEGVSFADPTSPTTVATFPASGTYVLRLSANDSELSAQDEVTVTVHPEPPPTLSVQDTAAIEGQEGVTGATVVLSLSKPWPRPVTVDYVTSDGTAVAGCDYRPRYGTLRLEPGQSEATLLVPVVGELVPEGSESIVLRLGNVTEAVLERSEATIAIEDDDAENGAPGIVTGRAPPDGATSVSSPALLTWASTDPDPGDALTHDVYFGTAFGTTGQSWARSCPATAGPASLASKPTGYDEDTDRLITWAGDSVWVLEHATRAGGPPRWLSLPAAGGPEGTQALAFRDAATNQLIVHGGCSDAGCSSATADLLALSNANGIGGGSAWTVLRATGHAPALRNHAGAYDAATGTLILFGGLDGSGQPTNEVWLLRGAAAGTPAWSAVTPAGPRPAPREGASAVYDPAGNRLIVFGGQDATRAYGDVWALSNANGIGGPSTWTRLLPGGSGPAARSGHSAAYDAATGRMLVFGGTTAGVAASANFVFNDAWMLRLEGVGATWERLAPVGGSPLARFGALSIFSETANRFVVVGGANNRSGAPGSDVWVLADAMGSLPLASANQVESTFAADLAPGAMHYWRVVTRDTHGAWRGSVPWRLTSNRAPTVDAGPDQAVEVGAVSLQGTVTDDGLPGAAVAVAWRMVSGPLPVLFSDASAASTVAEFRGAGSYVLELTASDSQLSARDEVRFEVRGPNQPPLVDAGPDQEVTLPAGVDLVGTVADDGLPSSGVVTSAWAAVGDNATAVRFADATSAVTRATFSQPGTFTLRLTASDSALSASDELIVVVHPALPPPDLRISSVNVRGLLVDGQTLAAGGTLSATVTNPGAGPAASFEVAFFEDRDLDGALDPTVDLVLGSSSVAGLAAGASATVSAHVQGTLSFVGNLVHVMADSGSAVTETDESNNVADSAPPCVPGAPRPTLSMKLEWSWEGSTNQPTFKKLAATPAAGDLDGDGIPEVVFTTYQGNEFAQGGRIRAVNGRTGADVFVTDPAHPVLGNSTVAIGDLEGDGKLEVFAPHVDSAGAWILAFEHDGRLRWKSDAIHPLGSGGVSLADLDGDGRPEVVASGSVLDANGRLRWQQTLGRGAAGFGNGFFTNVADLDMDGRPEVVAGNTAYRADGTVLWYNATVPDGVTAIGNFDSDAYPEIVLGRDGRVWMLEHTGAVRWGPITLAHRSGPPVIADVDGDGQPEIGIAHAVGALTVLEGDGSRKWTFTGGRDESAITGASAFDFDGDGSAEIVFSDELELRVLRGTDGAVLAGAPVGSVTGYEYPVVADVDADGAAEIVAVASDYYGTPRNGIFVYGDAANGWPGARGIWNQYGYHVTNVNDDGTIPRHETNSWAGPNGYRQSILRPGCAYARPDLTASFVRIADGDAIRTITARIGNGGLAAVASNVPVSFYDGDPADGGQRLGIVRTTTFLAPGQYQDLSLDLASAVSTRRSIWVVADDQGELNGTVTETDETNNLYDSGLALVALAGAPDLTVLSVETFGMTVDPGTLSASGTVSARVRNQGEGAAGPFAVRFFEDRDRDGAFGGADLVLAQEAVANLQRGATTAVFATPSGHVQFRGSPVHVFVDADETVAESDESNNVAGSGEACLTATRPAEAAPQLEWSWTGSAALPAYREVFMTPAVADLNGDGTPDLVFSSASGGFAILRAVSGRDGSEIFSVTNPSWRVLLYANVAVGDIDADGRPEIVAAHEQYRLIAFEHDGSFKWLSPPLETSPDAGAPSLADLDRDGVPEIVMGRQALNADGSIRWTGTAGRGASPLGPLSYAADLDLDGTPEVVAGNTVYTATGAVRWTKSSVPDGLTALAELDRDPFPEIVHVSSGVVRAFEHDGTVKWGPTALPGQTGGPGLGHGGPPAIADFDGDGRMEIAVASAVTVTVLDETGSIRWFAPVKVTFWGVPGVSAADLDGDGASEVVFGDDQKLRVFRGTDGAVLFETPLGGLQRQHYPFVADVDGDGNAEIVAVANDDMGGTARGVYVYGDRNDRWVAARRVWNQHAYHVTNVREDLTIPADPRRSWEGLSGFRSTRLSPAHAFASPDLTASFVRAISTASLQTVTVRVGNAGRTAAPSGVLVEFHAGDPSDPATLLGTVSTPAWIPPGGFLDVTLGLPASATAHAPIAVVVDTGAAHSECDETNNVFVSDVRLNQPPMVETAAEVEIVRPETTAAVEARVSDDGLPEASTVSVEWTAVSGPGSVTFADPSSPTTTVTVTEPGTYVLRITATDTVLSTSVDVTLTLHAGNLPPVVDAGADRTITLPPTDTVALDGSATDDGVPLGSALTVTWSKVSGAGAVIFADATAATTTARFTEPGTYVLRLAATDSELTTSDDVTVVVERGNRPPSVSAGPDRSMELPNDTLVIDADVTDDGLPEGSTVAVSWTQVSGPAAVTFASPSAVDTQVTFPASGTYALRLTATDTVLAAADEVTVTVAPANLPPVVEAGADQTITLPPTSTVSLAGSVTDDGLPAGGSLVSGWSLVSPGGGVVFGDPSSPATTATFAGPGTYVLRLSATDGRLVSQDEVTVVVQRGNRPPVVDAGADQAITLPTDSVVLEGSVSDDGLPSDTLTSRWVKVGGPGAVTFATPGAPHTVATFDAPGSYTLRLSATDGALSASDDVAVVVAVAAPEGDRPRVTLTTPSSGEVVTAPVEVVGSVASPALFRWTLERRLAGEDGWTLLATGRTPVSGRIGTFDPTLLLNGVHELRLSALDTAGRSATAAAAVIVKDNLKVGHFTVSFVDLEVPVSGIPIRITRTYDSRDKRRGDFGIGWRMDVSSVSVQETATAGLDWQGTSTGGFFPTYCVQPTKPHVVTVSLPGGQVGEFEMTTTPQCQPFVPPDVVQVQFRPRPGTYGTLVPVGDTEAWLLGSWPGTQEMYSSADFSLYDPAVYEYTTPDGRKHLIHQVVGLTRVTDTNGNSLQITPDGITHSSGKGVAFTRDAEGRIRQITDPAGATLTYGYDAAGDLVAATDRASNTTTYTYEDAFPHHLKEIKDPLDRTPIRNEYYDDGRLKSHTDAFGKTILYTHDLSARQEIVTDRNGAIRVLGYDTRGNVVREAQPDGKVILRTFDDRNNRRSETVPHDPATMPDPPKTTYVYDDQDNLRMVTDPEGNTTEYTYNARRQVETTKDGRGRITRNAYDPATGNLLSTTDAMQNVTSYTYDPRGNVKTQTVTVDGQALTTTYEYDGSGNLRKEIDPTGHATEYTYDANGNRRTQTTTRTLPAGTIETLVTTYEYDANGQLAKTIDPDGTSTRTVYDAFGRQKETFDKLDRRTAYEYDAMGRLLKTTFPDLTYEESTYDNEGRRLTSRDREGRVTRYEYDAMGRLRKTIFPDESFTENVYDDAGRLVESWDARRKKTAYGYDDAGRRTSVRDPLGHETTFTYDANGNQETVKDARGHTTRFEYDDLNRRRKTIFPDGTYTETGYDELGRRTSERDQAGRVTRFAYDALGRLRKVIDARGKETTYGYDELGNRTSQTDANGHVTRFEYDRLGREVARVLPGGARETKTYWPNGMVKARTDFLGRTTSYEYDASDRLRLRTYPSGPPVSFTYTNAGRRETVTDGRGTTSYTYDLRGRLKTMAYPDGRRLEYDWDSSGNRTLLRAVVGGLTLDTTFNYDDASRLDVVTDPAGRAYDHGYDRNGNRESLSYPNGTSTAYTYDDLNRLETLTTTGPAGVVQSYAFTLGPSGNREHIDEADGTRRSYTYDDLYRLTGERITINGVFEYEKTFTYDDVGNRLTQVTTGSGAPGTPTAPGSLSYGYDERDRLVLEGGQTHTWDENGNLTAKVGEATYAWDFENRLIRVETSTAIVEHAYDADGNRVQTKVTPATGPPTTTDYLVDTSGSLSHVVAETTVAGTLQAYYVRGDDLLAVLRPAVPSPAPGNPADWQSRFFHPDGIGSIRRLTDEAGQVTDSYTYTAFGELISHAGSDPQPYAFAGEPCDPNSAFQYHRARWMDPSTGRFAAVDPWGGNGFDPRSLHRYLYAFNEPLAHADPTGEWTVSAQAVGSAILSVLAGGVVNAAITGVFKSLKGEDITAADLKHAFLVGAVTAPVGGVMFRAFAPLFKVLGGRLVSGLGAMQALTLPGKPAIEKMMIRFARHMFNTNRHYPSVDSTYLGRLLKRAFPEVQWEMHHVYIQQCWSRVGPNQVYSSVTGSEGLRRIGNGLWNLLPIPRSLNLWLGQPQNQWATQMLATIYYSSVVYGIEETDDALTEAISLALE